MFRAARRGRPIPRAGQQLQPLRRLAARRAGADRHRHLPAQARQVGRAAPEQPLALAEGHILVVKGGQHVQDEQRDGGGRLRGQQCLHLEAGEGARQGDAVQCVTPRQPFAAHLARDVVGVELVAAVQNAQRPVAGHAGGQRQHAGARRMRSDQQQHLPGDEFR